MPEVSGVSDKSLRVLIIDDRPEDIILTKRILKKHNSSSFTEGVTSGEKGLEKLSSREYDVLLLDYQMPGMNGLKILRGIKERGYDVPVIMITGRGDEQIAVDSIKEGAYDYVLKKSDDYKDKLPLVIERVLKRHRILREKLKLEIELKKYNEELNETVRKISGLISLAEEKQGFEVRFENHNLVRCWEVKKCTNEKCPVYILKEQSKDKVNYSDMDLRCWQIAGTHCGGKSKGIFVEKLGRCEQCEIYRKAIPDKLSELGENFNNMMAILQKKAMEIDELQHKYFQAEKLAGIGKLTAGIAHSFNNPLYGIMGMAEEILDEDNPRAVKEYARDIIKYSKEAASIVTNLSSYARIAKSKSVSNVDINNVLDEALKMVRHSSAWVDIEVDKDYDNIPAIRADSVEIQQAFTNIINNAVQAMEGCGRLSLSIRSLGQCIEVRIKDSGPGISEENRERIFEPFFTTKELGEGTGLGLSLSREIINKYNGSVKVENEVGKGATFIVNFAGE